MPSCRQRGQTFLRTPWYMHTSRTHTFYNTHPSRAHRAHLHPPYAHTEAHKPLPLWKQRLFLYCTHSLQTFGDRLWAFAVPILFINIWPQTLLPSAIFVFVTYLGTCPPARPHTHAHTLPNTHTHTHTLPNTHTHTHTHLCHTHTHTHTGNSFLMAPLGGWIDRANRMEVMGRAVWGQCLAQLVNCAVLWLLLLTVPADGALVWTLGLSACFAALLVMRTGTPPIHEHSRL